MELVFVRRKFTASLVGRTSAVRVALQPDDSVALALNTSSAATTERKNRVIRLAGETHTRPRCARPGVRSASNGGYGLSVSTQQGAAWCCASRSAVDLGAPGGGCLVLVSWLPCKT